MTRTAALTSAATVLLFTAACHSRNRGGGTDPNLLPTPQQILEYVIGAPILNFAVLTLALPTWVPTQNSNLNIPPQLPMYRFTEAFQSGYAIVDIDAAQLQQAFLGAAAMFPQGDGPNGLTLAANLELPMGPGRYLLTWQCFEEDIPLNDPVNLLQYAYVADSDNLSSNNYFGQAPFEGDFFDDTDLWFAAEYAPTLGWELRVTNARNGTFTQTPSAARCILSSQAQFLVIPIKEFDDSMEISGRYTAFAHTGDFGQSGGPWSADISPPVEEPLLRLSFTPRF